MFLKKVFSIAALSVIGSLAYTGSAQAISFRMTTGAASPSGETNQGAYSEFAGRDDVETIDFNDGTAPTTGFAQFSFTKGDDTSSVRQDRWAPAGANGEVNESNYLAVFQGDDVVINLAKNLNYFGMDWGAISPGNVFSFYNGDSLVESFSTSDVNPVAPIKAQQHNDEGNGYLHFYSTSAQDIFNKIVITQTGGGGFETDNYSFHAGNNGFDFDKEIDTESVPEPSFILGMLAVGGMFVSQRKKQKPAELS